MKSLPAAFALMGLLTAGAVFGDIGGRVLHEYLPPAAGSSGRSDHVVSDGSGDDLPEAIDTALGRLTKPKASPPGSGAPLYEPRAQTTAGPDRRTGGDLDLHYQMVFDPEVAPFKRETSLDQIGPDLRARPSGQGNRQQQTAQGARPGHELFWGHVQVRLEPNQPVVLPSVAPTSQVLAWHPEPPVALQLWRDDAGNFTVRADYTGIVDLRFLMDAPSDYFAAPLGVGVRDDDPQHPKLPAELQKRAEALWPALGVQRQMERGAAVSKLVEWFRGFQPGEPPPSTGEELRDLVLSQKGVCRHRALGFVVMAHSLGISAHFVSNDAHAFAEVWAPGVSGMGAWQRVDLGGGADSLELHGAQGKHLHQPLHRDPFPQPPAYANATGQVKVDGAPLGQSWAGAGQVKGADGLQQAGGAQGAGLPSTAGSAGGTSAAGAMSAGDGTANGSGAAPPSELEKRRAWLRQRAEALAAPAHTGAGDGGDKRALTSLQLAPLGSMAWLGEPLQVAGQLKVSERAAGGQPIEIWLIDPAQPAQGFLLGVAATGSDGRFSARLNLPADADPRVYDVVARFGGDHLRAPCDSGP